MADRATKKRTKSPSHALIPTPLVGAAERLVVMKEGDIIATPHEWSIGVSFCRSIGLDPLKHLFAIHPACMRE